MKPILHSAAAWAAAENTSIQAGTMAAISAEMDSNGVGILTDCISCIVSEERNAEYELTLVYPVEGIHYTDLQQRAVIMAKPNPISDSQPFRIYRITRPLSGRVTVYAQHISYDLDGIILKPFSRDSASQTFSAIAMQAMTPNLYSFWTDKTTTGKFAYTEPKTVRQVLGGENGSILDICGSGDYEFDRYTVRFHADRGADRGVTIRYGKNLTSLKQEENCSCVYTGIVPYWTHEGTDGAGETIYLQSDPIVKAEGTYDFVRTKPVDFSEEFDEQPTEAQLRTAAQSYIKANNIGVPSVSLDVSFVQLAQTEEYKDIAQLEEVLLCDTVTVQFEKLGVNATARINKTEFDVLTGRYKSVSIGDVHANLAVTINRLSDEIKANTESNRKAQSSVHAAIERATELITGNRGGYVILHSSTGAENPDEILIMDTPDIKTAKKVWRWNQSGLGYSNTGYNGKFGLAITMNGQIVADYIATGELNASLLKTGTFEVSDYNGHIVFSAIANGTHATPVKIGGWNVNRKAIYYNSGSEFVNINGEGENFLECGYKSNGKTVWPLIVSRRGSLYATGAVIEGKITAESGAIGGWTIGEDTLYTCTNTGEYTYLQRHESSDSNNGYVFASGASNTEGEDAKFAVLPDGSIIAKTGVVGGCLITETGLRTGWENYTDGGRSMELTEGGFEIQFDGRKIADFGGGYAGSRNHRGALIKLEPAAYFFDITDDDNTIFRIATTTVGNSTPGANIFGNLNMHNYDMTKVGTISYASDRRLKQNIADSTVDALAIARKIHFRAFDWKTDNRHEPIGIIAQELFEFAPEFVDTPDAEEDTYSIFGNRLLMLALRAIQQQDAEIKEIKTELKSLKEELLHGYNCKN